MNSKRVFIAVGNWPYDRVKITPDEQVADKDNN